MQTITQRQDAILQELRLKEERPALLLHACCAPCSSYVIEYLAPYFALTVYYYNPNIYPTREYTRRLEELEHFLKTFPPAVKGNVGLIVQNDASGQWQQELGVKECPSLKAEGERGERCLRCYRHRLRRTREYALLRGYKWWCTTLTISPHKDALAINDIACALDIKGRGELRFLASDFKKREGFKRSIVLSREYGLYRQDYCGCIYSLKDSRALPQSLGAAAT